MIDKEEKSYLGRSLLKSILQLLIIQFELVYIVPAVKILFEFGTCGEPNYVAGNFRKF